MNITYLGTGGSEGIPAFFCRCPVCEGARKLKGREIRSRTGVLLDDRLMIDFSPDMFLHTLMNDFDLSAIKYLLITHTHSDHYYPEDLMMRFACNAINPTEKILNVYGNEYVKKRFEELEPPEEISVCTKLSVMKEMETVVVGEYRITPFQTEHMLYENSFMYLIQRREKSYLHAVDSSELSETVFTYLKENKIQLNGVSFDCTFGSLREEYFGHMNIWQTIKMKNRLEENRNIAMNAKFVLTHISHFSGNTYDELRKLAEKYGMIVAYDGLQLEL